MTHQTTRDGFNIVRVHDFDGEFAVQLGDGTVIYADTEVAPRDLWLWEPADHGLSPKFRVYQTLQSGANRPVKIPYGLATDDRFSLVQSMISAMSAIQNDEANATNPDSFQHPVLISVTLVRESEF